MSNERPYAELLQRLRAVGLRPTRQRLALARLLFEKGDRHLTADQRTEVTQAAGFLADYLEAEPDQELDRLIQAALPAPLARHLESQTVPHRMHVGVPEGPFWSCDNCGATYDSLEKNALLVSDRPGYSSLHRDIVFCAACVTVAAVELSDHAETY